MSNTKQEVVIGDIYGCDDHLCKRCVKCNPLHYWMKKNRLDKINETINDLKMYNEKRCNAFINGLECKIIDENFNLIKSKKKIKFIIIK